MFGVISSVRKKRSITSRVALRLLEQDEDERQAKLKALRQAAKKGFDEIDQGKGIVLKGKKALKQFITEIEAEVSSRSAKNGR